jgi:hypothetical protein
MVASSWREARRRPHPQAVLSKEANLLGIDVAKQWLQETSMQRINDPQPAATALVAHAGLAPPALPPIIPVAAPASTCSWIVEASPRLWLRFGTWI